MHYARSTALYYNNLRMSFGGGNVQWIAIEIDVQICIWHRVLPGSRVLALEVVFEMTGLANCDAGREWPCNDSALPRSVEQGMLDANEDIWLP